MSNYEKAQNRAATDPNWTNCCSGDGFDLLINFEPSPFVVEDCTVIPGEALLYYPPDGATGSVEVCVSFPTLFQTGGYFEIHDAGDFTSVNSVETFLGTDGNGDPVYNIETEICRQVSYPSLNDAGQDLGFVRSNFYVTTHREGVEAVPITQNIYGRVNADDFTCSCADDPISVGFSENGDRAQYTTPNGSNLSTLYTECEYCFPGVDNINGRANVYLYGGGLNVDIDYTYGQSGQNRYSTLTLAKDFQIRIKGGATLDLRNVYVQGCDAMWDAIIVEDGGELLINPGSSGTFPGLIRQSFVTDGKRGIVVEDGGKLTVNNTTFTENYVGISTPDDDQRKAPEINIFGSTFNFGEGDYEQDVVVQPFLLPPHAGEIPRAGVELHDVDDGVIVDYGLTLETSSEFENLRNGMILNRSYAFVSGTDFTRMKELSEEISGNGILINAAQNSWRDNYAYVRGNINHPNGGVSFSHSPYGIRAYNPYILGVSHATFSDIDFGVYADNPFNLNVRDSEIESDASGVTAFRRRPGTTRISRNRFNARNLFERSEINNAIRLASLPDFFSERAYISDNEFKLDDVLVGVYVTDELFLDVKNNDFTFENERVKATALLVEGGSINYARGNFVEGDTEGTPLATGFQFNSAASVIAMCNRLDDLFVGMDFIGNNGRSSVRGNIMENSITGLKVGSETDLSMHVIGRQVHNGNKWLGSFAEEGASYRGDVSEVQLSEFIVDDDGPGCIPPSWDPSAFFIVEPNSLASFYSCPEGLPPPGNFTGSETYTANLINDQIDWTDKLPAAEWTANIQALKSFYEGKLTESKVPGVTYWASAPARASENAGLSLSNEVALTLSPPAYDNDFIAVRADRLDEANITYALSKIEAERAHARGHAVNSNKLAIVAAERQHQQDSLNELIYDPGYDFAQRLASARNQNNAGNPSEQHRKNDQLVNHWLLNLAESGKEAIKKDLIGIVAVARQCPEIGGPAVFKARSLAASLGADDVYDNALLCAEEKEKRAVGDIEESPALITVFPNPADGEITVTSRSFIESIHLYDSFGRRVSSYQIGADQQINQYRINTATLTAGTYSLAVNFANDIIETHVLIVRK